MEFFGDTILLGGFQKNISFVKQYGNTVKNIEFDFMIRHFKPAPLTNTLIIYSQDRRLLCSDMDGNILWQIENLTVHSSIEISERSYTGYFILDPNDLLKFDISGQSFFEICDERNIKSFSVSYDGKKLLVLDSENTLIMYNEDAGIEWENKSRHNITHMKLSSGGNLFMTVDDDGILSCYSNSSDRKQRHDFFEITEDKRILEKDTLWTIRPGGRNDTVNYSELTVSPDKNFFGLSGKDGSIHFCDEHGTARLNTSFTSAVKEIGISRSFLYGYIYGDKEIKIIDFMNSKIKYILFSKSPAGNPIVNYHHKKIFTLSKEKELLAYDFDGTLLDTALLTNEYGNGISCEEHGFILFNKNEIAGYSETGKASFIYPVTNEIKNIFYAAPFLICLLKDHRVIRINLSTRKVKTKPLKVLQGDSEIVSIDPLFIVTGNKKLHHLAEDLSIIKTYDIESLNSHFYIDEESFYEIIKRYNGFYCYNEKKDMVWRHPSNERIIDSALTKRGLVFSTEDSVQFLELKKNESIRGELSNYLEI